MTVQPSLPALESLVARHQSAQALEAALNILEAIDRNYGGLREIQPGATYLGCTEEGAAVLFATRFAAAFGRLMTEVDLDISAVSYHRLAFQHRWIDLIFSLSSFRSSDAFIRVVGTSDDERKLSFEGEDLLRLLAMLTMNSFINVDFDRFWRLDRVASAVAFLNYISSRYVFSGRAFEFRERLLAWIPDRLTEIKLGSAVLGRAAEIYMHCSYAITADKHAIKRSLMTQMRRACLEAGVIEASPSVAPRRGDRATVVVVGEQFVRDHATFRCFARAVESLRPRFNVVGVLYPDATGTSIEDCFDECIVAPRAEFLASVRTVAAAIVAHKPALIFYLGVGMVAQVIALASLRLAPIQCASIGHNASTMSPMMDYFILPEDWVGSQERFSETVVALPKAALPFSPRPGPAVRRRAPDGTIRVAIAASTMKLNPVLFDALSRIDAGVKTPVEFHFFAGFASGLVSFELLRVVREKLSRVTVHPQTSYERYMERLALCDIFLSPFPHGGMTSIMDTFALGIPGICLDGAEPHEHADAAIFARIELPKDLITASVDEYVAAAIRLIGDADWRRRCADIVRNADLDAAFFSGDPRLFCAAIEQLIWRSAK